MTEYEIETQRQLGNIPPDGGPEDMPSPGLGMNVSVLTALGVASIIFGWAVWPAWIMLGQAGKTHGF